METENKDWNRISAYLSGQLTDQEKNDFHSWIDSADYNQQMFREARALWNHSTIRHSMPQDETEQGWADFISKRDEKPAVNLWTTPWLRIAASITLLVGLLYIVNMFRHQSIELVAGNTVGTFYLPDSSVAWLNTGAKLRYSDNFNSGVREVTLEGEGFFKVKPNKEKPFIVSSENASIRVLGTSFNVSTKSENTVVSVAEGIVSVHGDGKDSVILVEGDEAVVTREGSVSQGKITDPGFSSWRLQNNPVATRERDHPELYLSSTAEWKKNLVNMSVIEGVIHNTSSLVTFEKVVIKVTYLKTRGEQDVFRITMEEKVGPGQQVNYQKRLLDILTMTKLEKVEIESAVAAD